MTITKENLIENLKNDLSEPNLLIFKNSVEVLESSQNLTLSVSDPYMKQWIENKCLTLIKSYVENRF